MRAERPPRSLAPPPTHTIRESSEKIPAPRSGSYGHEANIPGKPVAMTPRSRMPQRIRDPLHGLIVFGDSHDSSRNETDRIAWSLLNTPEFQRLRRIRQLGFSDLVFPGATHSRFAHCVGAYHVARRLADVIGRQHGHRDPDRERVALLAALLHDVGHGPFSHAFEAADPRTDRISHERWGAKVVRGETRVNRLLREADETLPERIGGLLTGDDGNLMDIYAAIVSSQFDADRLDYLQRDRMAAGVGFGHIDRDWLFDSLEVGDITVGADEDDPYPARCLYLGPKGVSVAEEYLEARYRLYTMLYMHKTTRAAEKMLESVLCAIAAAPDRAGVPDNPVFRYMTDETPSLGAYLALDDAAVWAALGALAERSLGRVSELATRLRNRDLYKCVEIGARDRAGANLYRRFRRALNAHPAEWRDGLLYDRTEFAPYRSRDLVDTNALNMVLVKPTPETPEPIDIARVSDLVAPRVGLTGIERVYAPDAAAACELRNLLREIENDPR